MIAHTIQLALAPSFVLVAIGNMLNLLSTRVGRIIDRARHLQERHGATEGAAHDMLVAELRLIDRRVRLSSAAMRLLVLSALATGSTVAVLFGEEMLDPRLEHVAAVTFLVAIALLLCALLLFLRETQIAAEALRIPRDYLELHRDL